MKAAALLVGLVLGSPALAAGNGAGAGGAGHQRAINSGLVDGPKGPPGSTNNPRPTPPPAEGIRGSARPETAPR